MWNRLARLCVVVVLLAAAAAAAYVGRGWLPAPAVSASADLDPRVERLLALTSELRGAETAYVVPGQDPTPALEDSRRRAARFRRRDVTTGGG